MIRTLSFAAALIAFLGVLAPADAHEYSLGGLKIVHPWGRATPPGATTAAAYFRLVNTGRSVLRLTGASSAAADRVEIHTMSMDGGVMRMRPVPTLDIAPGATIELKPSGMHMMLIGLRRPLLAEDMIPVTLTFADGGSVAIEVYVEAMGHEAPAHMHP